MPDLNSYGLPLAPERGGLTGSRKPRVRGVRVTQVTPQVRQPRLPSMGVGRQSARPLPQGLSPLDTIKTYARARRTVIITYRKVTANLQQVVREIEPYEIKNGYLWGFCLPHRGIHKFLLGNIVSVQGTTRRYLPRWPVLL